MQKLLRGAIEFMKNDFSEQKELFENLANKQKPHTLFIGCADSRVVPNLITKTGPGELFTVRNIANIVPHYRISPEFVATTAAIEYAIYALKVKNVVICGHSNCGGCSSLWEDEKKFRDIPNVKHWLDLMAPVKDEISKIPDLSPTKKMWITERLNIINSYENLLTYPHILEWLEKGKIRIFAWHYIIETGEIFSYNQQTKSFKLLEKSID